MPFLKCQRCKGYYELQDGESPEEFERCQCGSKLKYVETLEELNDYNVSKPNRNDTSKKT